MFSFHKSRDLRISNFKISDFRISRFQDSKISSQMSVISINGAKIRNFSGILLRVGEKVVFLQMKIPLK